MKSRKTTICIAVALLISVTGRITALDLSKYQSYMSSPRSQQTKTTQQQQQIYQDHEYSDLDTSVNADTYYVQGQAGQYVPLASGQRKDGEHYLLPPETRVPKELRPLLTERRTPRQGLAIAGGTGATLIPSPGVLEPNKTAIGIHIQAFDLYNVNGTKYQDKDYFDTNLSLAFGMEEGVEVGIDKVFSNQDRYEMDEPLYLNFKYQAPANITLGANFCADDGYHSVWAGAGVPVIWVGIGANFGPETYKYTIKGLEKLRKSRFGGYNFDPKKGEGYADPLFFMIGGALPLNNNLRFIYDFNGDKFSLGFRFNYQNIAYLNAAFVSKGDYENLPEEVSHKTNQSLIFGGTIAW